MTVPDGLLVGTYFFLDTDRYVAHDDAVLTVLSAAALPVSCFVAWAEITRTGPTGGASLAPRGDVLAAVPYLAIAHVPWIHVAGIWLIAANTVLFLRFTGAADVHLGQITVVEGHQRIAWADWGGSRWFHLDPATEYPFPCSTSLTGRGAPSESTSSSDALHFNRWWSSSGLASLGLIMATEDTSTRHHLASDPCAECLPECWDHLAGRGVP